MMSLLFSLLGGFLLIHSSLCIPTGGVSPGLQGLSTRADGIDESEIGFCGGIADPTFETTGDDDDGQLGFWITNLDKDPKIKYFLYENTRDHHPWKYISIPQGKRAFVSVCRTFQGRVVRGTTDINLDEKSHNLGTWFQATVALHTGSLWGGISFLEGCDGGGSMSTTDGTNVTHGCIEDLLTHAPGSALATKDSNVKVLDKLVGKGANAEAKAWELSLCSPDEVYIDTENHTPNLKSDNGQLEVVFYMGK